MTEPSVGFAQFAGRRYINLETYKKDGTPRLTPVQSVGDQGLVYFRTDPKTWKIRRIESNPRVRIVLSDRNGKPAGSWVDGEARILHGEESVEAMALFRKEYGAFGNSMVSIVGRLRGERLTTVVAVQPVIP